MPEKEEIKSVESSSHFKYFKMAGSKIIEEEKNIGTSIPTTSQYEDLLKQVEFLVNSLPEDLRSSVLPQMVV